MWNKKGLLQDNLPANGKHLALLLKQVLTLTIWDITSYKKEKISKGKFSTMLNSVLDKYNKLIATTLDPYNKKNKYSVSYFSFLYNCICTIKCWPKKY